MSLATVRALALGRRRRITLRAGSEPEGETISTPPADGPAATDPPARTLCVGHQPNTIAPNSQHTRVSVLARRAVVVRGRTTYKAAEATAVSSFVQNKPNSRCFPPANGVSAERRTQSKPIWATGRLGRPGPPLVSSFAPNKANLRRFWARNTGEAKEQSQSKPIWAGCVGRASPLAKSCGDARPTPGEKDCWGGPSG